MYTYKVCIYVYIYRLIYLAFKSEDIIYGQRQKEGKFNSRLCTLLSACQLLVHKWEVPIFPYTPAGGSSESLLELQRP